MVPPTTEQYLFVPAYLFLWLAVLLAGALFAYRVSILSRMLLAAKPDRRHKEVGERVRALIVYFFAQARLFKYPGAGLMHALIFWGFLILSLGTIETFGKGLFAGSFALPLLDGNPAFLLTLDAFTVLVMGAVLVATFRRLIVCPARLTLSGGAYLILGLIFSLMVTDLLADASRMVIAPDPADVWSPAASALSGLLSGLSGSTVQLSYDIFWWAHVLILLAFLVYIPQSKHLHIGTAPFNVYFRDLNKGALPHVDLENSESFGISKVDDLTWKGLLDLYTCTECGRCQDNCPAFATHKPLSPKEVILDLRDEFFTEKAPQLLHHRHGNDKVYGGGKALVGEIIEDETLWSCTTCRACMEQCPVFIEHIPKIVEMRRHLVLEESRFPTELKPVFDNLERRGNPWEIAAQTRADWAKDLDVPTVADNEEFDYLYFVGCFGSFDERNTKVSKAMAKVLKAAGINFAILGADEKCCGDPARRAGNEYLYQMMVKENVELFNSLGVKKIITQCPHCYNTLKNEYPQYGGNYEVHHYAEVIAPLVAEGRLRPTKCLETAVTFHDPCYLGRHNDVYDAPRRILQAIPDINIVEMPKSKSSSFCCGGGGARAFMEEHTGERINATRVGQAQATGASLIAAACPYCITMFDDGIKAKDLTNKLKVKDCVELLAETL